MGLFHRKKDDLDSETSPESGSPKKKGAESRVGIQRLDAKVEALNELRRADAERFTRINEEIGELRSLILSKEEEIRDLGVKATKAASMVDSLQPENIISELRKSTAKYETLSAKIEAATALYQSVMDELKKLREKMSIFQGTEELVKLNQETAKNLAIANKSKDVVERQANLVGNTFTQFQKYSKDFLRNKDIATATADRLREMLNEMDDLKLKAQSSLVSRDDFNELSKELKEQVKGFAVPDSTAGKRFSDLELEINDLKREFTAALSQKEYSGQLASGALADFNRRLAEFEEDSASLKKELGLLKDRLESAAQAPVKSDILVFEAKLAMLEDAVRSGDSKLGVALYEEARDIFPRIVKGGMPDDSTKSMRARMISAYNSLSRHVN